MLMWLLIPIGYPLSKALDFILGHHELTRFNNKELKALLGLHTEDCLERTKFAPKYH